MFFNTGATQNPIASPALYREAATGQEHTPTTVPYFTNPGNFLPFDRRPQSFLAASSVATSIARKGILFAFRIVSKREVAVMIWEDPAVSEV